MIYPEPEHAFGAVDAMFLQAITARAILTAVELGLFDHTCSSPTSAQALAKELGVKSEPLEAMLDMLAASDLLTIHDGKYGNTPMTNEYLVSTSPLYRGDTLKARKRFEDMLKDGIPALLKGETKAEKGSEKKWATAEFMQGMLQQTLNGQLQTAVRYLSSLPEFASFRTMADIGGNHGQFSMELIDRNPSLTSTLLDLPEVVKTARQRCSEQGYAHTITCQPFDLQKELLPPNAYDLVFASHILYTCREKLDDILDSIHASLKPGGCFASHHYSGEGGAFAHQIATTEFISRISGRGSHMLERSPLEQALERNGFHDFTHTFTGTEKQTLLLVARKR